MTYSESCFKSLFWDINRRKKGRFDRPAPRPLENEGFWESLYVCFRPKPDIQILRALLQFEFDQTVYW